MILTNCAACAAPLALDHKKRCSRCKTTKNEWPAAKKFEEHLATRDRAPRGAGEAVAVRLELGGGDEMMELLRRAAATFEPAGAFEVPASQDTIAGPASPFVEPEPPWQPSKGTRGFSLSSPVADPDETRLSTQVPPPPPDSEEEIEDPSPRVPREKNVSWSLDDSVPPERIASSTQGSPWPRAQQSRYGASTSKFFDEEDDIKMVL